MLQNVTSVAFEMGEFASVTDILDQLKGIVGRGEVRFGRPDVLLTQNSVVGHEKVEKLVVSSIECV